MWTAMKYIICSAAALYVVYRVFNLLRYAVRSLHRSNGSNRLELPNSFPGTNLLDTH